jgi:glycosyltransferase involved in cell wall biosynthesis
MKILNIVSVLSAREGGGNAERTIQMSRAFVQAGHDCSVLTLDIGDPRAQQSSLGGIRIEVIPCLGRRFQVPSLRDLNRIQYAVEKADVIHLMGYWSLLGALVGRMAERARIPYVISPAGALPIFGRSRFFKFCFNVLLGNHLLRRAAGWIAVTLSEVKEFQAYGVPSNQIIVIPNGVAEMNFLDMDILENSILAVLLGGSFILYMGRLNYIKGPDLLIESFAIIAREFPHITLVIAGPDEGMKASLMERVKELDLLYRVKFLGFITGQSKLIAYHRASLLVVPSRSEAMSIVAVEAGACGTPVLMTNQCGLHDLREVDDRLVVEPTAVGLATGLRTALQDLDRLELWGVKWRQLVMQRFLWRNLADKFITYLDTIVEKKVR